MCVYVSESVCVVCVGERICISACVCLVYVCLRGHTGARGDQRSIVGVVFRRFLSFGGGFFTEPGACWFSYVAWPLSFSDCLSLSTDAVVSDFLP